MAINKKLIHFDMTKQLFMSNANGLNNLTKPTNGIVGNIPYYSVVFLKDGYIWTHGHFINGTGIADSVSSNATISWYKITDKPSTFIPSAHTQSYTTLTGSGTTANQAIVSSGTANGWTLKTLGSRAFDSTSYLPLSGGTMNAGAMIVWQDWGQLGASSPTYPKANGGLQWSGTSDWIKLFAEETAPDDLRLILQCGDDTSPQFNIRNYEGITTVSLHSNGTITGTSIVNSGSNNNYVLLGGGGTKALSDFLYKSGGTLTGNLILKGDTTDNMTYSGNLHPCIRFDNSDSSQNVSLIFTDYDSYRYPAGLKLVGNQGNEWFEAPVIYQNGTKVSVEGHTHSYLPLSGGTMTGALSFSNNIGISGIMGGGSDGWGIVGTGENDNGRLKIYVADNATTDWLDFEFRDWSGTTYTPLSMTGNQIIFNYNPTVNGHSLIHTGNISPSLDINGNAVRVTAGGVNSSYITVPYATSAGNADTVDGCHESSFLRHRETTYTNQEGTLWSQIGIKQYNGALPDSLSNTYNWGQVITFAATDARFEIYASHLSSDNQGLYYRSGWDNDKKPWRHILDNYNSSVGKSGETLTVTINGTSQSLTNTWRGIQNNLTSSSTTDSLSAYQGYLLANGSARDNTKLPLAGGTMVGTISASSDAYGGGGFHNGYANIILRGNTTTGTSGIVFSSSKGDTSINRPSDCAFIQYHPYGISTATAVGTNPTIGTSGEAGRFVIGIHNDSGDQLWLQTSAANDLKHVVGASIYTIYDSGNLPAYPTKSSWNYDDRYVASVSISGNYLRINKNGANTDLTIPYANYARELLDNVNLSGGNTATYPWRRIATTGLQTSNYNDVEATILIRHRYDGGVSAILKICLRTNDLSSGESSGVDAVWLVRRHNYPASNVKIALYSVQGKAYADVYIKARAWQRMSINVLANYGWTFKSSSESDNGANPVEAYASIEAAATALYGVAYTSIIDSSDVGITARAICDSDGNAINTTYLKRSGGSMTGNITIGNSTFYASGSNGGINSLAVADDCILGDCNIGGHLGLKSLNTTNAGISFYNSSGGSLGRFTVNSSGTPTWNDTAFSLTNHNHDAIYFKHCSSNNTDPITGLYNGYGVCMTTTSGINGNWWHVFSAGWNNASDWISQLALPTQDTTRGAWFRIRQSSINSAWVRLHDTQNTYVSGNKGYINNTEITDVNNAGKLKITGYGDSGLTFYQTDGEFDGRSGWCHYIIGNHGNGASYYHYTIGLPFWSVPIYRRQTDNTSHVTPWYKFITEENIGSQSVASAARLTTARTLWGQSFDGTGNVNGKIELTYNADEQLRISASYTSGVNGYAHAIDVINPSLSSGEAYLYQIGRASSNSNLAYFGYVYGGDSGTSYATIGLHSHDRILNVTASDMVGIGTTTPSYKLDVNGTLHASGATTLSNTLYVGNNATIEGTLGVTGTTTLKSTTTITANTYISGETYFSAVDAFRLNYGSYGVIHRNDGGSYWILLTNKDNLNGGFNNLRPFHIDFSTGTVYMDNNAIIDNLAFTQCNISMGGRVNATWGYDLNTNDYYGLYFKSKNSSSTGILFNDDGNVGINTLSPSYKLDVNGTLRVSDTITATSLAADYNDTWSDGTHTHPWYGYDHRYANTGVYSTVISDYFGMTLKTMSGNISITNGGNVGIGTFAPLRKLHVIGEAIFGESGYVASQGTGSAYSGTLVGQGFMELSAPNPYIDFHANKSTADFTSRLIQWSDEVRLLYVSSDASYNGYILTCEGNHHNPVILGIFDLKRSGQGSTIWTLDNICGPCVFTLANNWGSDTTFDSHTYWTIPANLLRVEINGTLGANYTTKTTVKAASCIGTVMTRWINNQPVVSNRSHEHVEGCSVECLCTDKAPGTNLYYDSNSPGKYIYITGARPYGYDDGTNGLSMDQFRRTGNLSYLRVRFVVYGWLE